MVLYYELQQRRWNADVGWWYAGVGRYKTEAEAKQRLQAYYHAFGSEANLLRIVPIEAPNKITDLFSAEQLELLRAALGVSLQHLIDDREELASEPGVFLQELDFIAARIAQVEDLIDMLDI